MYKGLTREEAEQKIREGRINQQKDAAAITYRDIIRKNVVTYFNFINTVLFIVVLFTGKPVNGLFYITVLVNSMIGIFQEVRAKRFLDRLRIMIAAEYEVCRSEEWVRLKGEEITEGDLVRVSAGMQVPADAVIVSGGIELNESMLTGEAETLFKKEGSHIYSGTIVTSGQAEARILRVGSECISSHILEDAGKAVRTGSQMRADMDRLIRIVSLMILPAGIVLFLAQYLYIGMEWREAALKTTAAVVGMIPEGLIVLTSIALAVSTIRLARKNVLVQDLYAVETLARTDAVCLDKTGTLTEGKMTVEAVIPVNQTDPEEIGSIVKKYLGSMKQDNMTSAALRAYFGSDETPAADILPFSSERKYGAVCLQDKGIYYLGSPENLFPERPDSLSGIDQYVNDGSRVLVLARSGEKNIPKELPEDLSPMGIILIRDVLRKNTGEIMKYFEDLGIRLYVISGDHPGTVSAIASGAGIPDADKCRDFSVIPQEESFFREAVEKYRVFGRVMPAVKKNIIEALQEKGFCTAMTGDGVNDVSALNTADIGISFASASQAARDSADIVLMSDDFGQVPSVINEGRRVINNIGRASSMYLVKTVFSVLLVFYAVLFRQEYPFLPVQLTLISSFAVGIPTFFMQFEPSFEKEKGRFLSRAFRNAVPSSVTVLCMVLYCMVTRNYGALSPERYYGQVVILTFAVYIYTLFKVSKPLSAWRIAIISAVTVSAAAVIFFFPEVFSLLVTPADLIMVLPAALLIAPCVRLNEIIYDKCFKHKYGGTNGKQNVFTMESGSSENQKNHES